jgi:hypothetical protein
MMKNGSTAVARSQECSNMRGRIGMAERVGFYAAFILKAVGY